MTVMRALQLGAPCTQAQTGCCAHHHRARCAPAPDQLFHHLFVATGRRPIRRPRHGQRRGWRRSDASHLSRRARRRGRRLGARVEQRWLRGAPFVSEVALYHRASRTWCSPTRRSTWCRVWHSDAPGIPRARRLRGFKTTLLRTHGPRAIVRPLRASTRGRARLDSSASSSRTATCSRTAVRALRKAYAWAASAGVSRGSDAVSAAYAVRGAGWRRCGRDPRRRW